MAVEFTVKAAPDSTHTLVTGMAGASLDGGAVETEPPAGSPVPTFAGWIDSSEEPRSGDSVLVAAEDDSRWTAYATLLPDASLQSR